MADSPRQRQMHAVAPNVQSSTSTSHGSPCVGFAAGQLPVTSGLQAKYPIPHFPATHSAAGRQPGRGSLPYSHFTCARRWHGELAVGSSSGQSSESSPRSNDSDALVPLVGHDVGDSGGGDSSPLSASGDESISAAGDSTLLGSVSAATRPPQPTQRAVTAQANATRMRRVMPLPLGGESVEGIIEMGSACEWDKMV